MTSGARGPAWLGIGAQRSGTTWFANLLLQHPSVDFGRDGRKEVHFFDRFLVQPWSNALVGHYTALFDPSRRAGDFTPSYLRCLWIPELVRKVCGRDALFIVLLRDPVERFASAMRWYTSRPGVPPPDRRNEYLNWVRDKGNDAIWGGMYARQLEAWTDVLPRERFVVMQYESVRQDPQAAVDRVWRDLGLEPRPLGRVSERSWNSTPDAQATDVWAQLPGLRDRLRALYAPEVEALVRTWGVDRMSWPNFA